MIRQNFEDNLRILANFGKFSRKNSKIYIFHPYVFKKLFFFFFFLIKIIVFTLKIFSFGPKIAFISFFYNKRCKNLWISPIRFQKTRSFFFVFFNIDYTFYTKNLFIRPKNYVQRIL